MKWIFYLIVFTYMWCRTVYGVKTLSMEPVNDDEGYLKVGARTIINCKGTSKNQKLNWLDPSGNSIKRSTDSRIHVKEQFLQGAKGGRIPALGLVINSALVSDTGLYQCRSDDNVLEAADVCVIEPSEFVDTPTEVTVDLGRSITLTCQAKGAPEPRLQWIRNGDTITDDDSSSKYRVMTKYNSQDFEGLLTITSLTPEDSGVYTCQSIQESPILASCVTTKNLNVTLQVSYAPIFEDGDDTKLVYGKNNQDANLTCFAAGFPLPEYRWFRDLGDGMFEYNQKQIKITEANEAVLEVTASSSTFGQRYKCRATNDRGVVEKSFVLLKMEKPRKPDKVNYYDATDSEIQLNVTWNGEIITPINGFDVQYLNAVLENKRRNGPLWARAQLIHVQQDPDPEGMIITIPNLEEDTEYWIRLRATNDVGESSWSDTTFAATGIKVTNIYNTGVSIYGIVFAGAVFIIAVACTFVIRYI